MALSNLIYHGHSWSGHERNCAYLNLGDATFADVSASVGVDFADDGRALAVTDWDGDGDLDFWIRNRSGPQLRFMRNRGVGGSHFFQLHLTGTTCNRDAVGAKVEVRVAGRRLVRAVMAGDGYLAQSSKWLHFGLGSADAIERVIVHWPDGRTQSMDGPAVNRRYRLTEGDDALVPVGLRNVSLACGPPPKEKPPATTRLLLKEPLPLPPTLTRLAGGLSASHRAVLINLWAHWCGGCLVELETFADSAGRMQANGLRVVALNLDEPGDHDSARRFFDSKVAPAGAAIQLVFADEGISQTVQAVLEHVRNRPGAVPLPASLLVDARGNLQMIYLGPVDIEQLLVDAQAFGQRPPPSHQRMVYRGRWYYKLRRNLPALAADLRRRGCDDDARFYEKLVTRTP